MPDRHAARHHMQTKLRRSAHSASRRSINCSIMTETRCNPIASLAPHANCSRHVGTDCASVSLWCTIRLPCPVYTDRAWHYTTQAFKLITTYASSYTWHSNYKLQTFKCKPSNCNLQTCKHFKPSRQACQLGTQHKPLTQTKHNMLRQMHSNIPPVAAPSCIGHHDR